MKIRNVLFLFLLLFIISFRVYSQTAEQRKFSVYGGAHLIKFPNTSGYSFNLGTDFRLDQSVRGFSELSFCNETSNSHNEGFTTVDLGIKAGSKNDEGFYFKAGLGLIVSDSYRVFSGFLLVNVGAGYNIELEKNIMLFPEVSGHIFPTFGSGYLNFGAGLKVYIL